MVIDANWLSDATPVPNRPNRLEPDDDGCPGIYAQSLLPSFELTIEPEVLALLQSDWENGQANEDAGIETNPERPLAMFKWEDVEITNATIRLRGNPTYWVDQNKMQFQIAFNRASSKGRFLGQRKILFDAASANWSFLRDRLGLHIMRKAGLPAPCANNARVYLNGDYYGLFTSIEKLDKEFLERVFPADPEGDLWKRNGWSLKTNETTSNNVRLEAMNGAATPAALSEYLDIARAIDVWAADAILPNADGPWAGGLNFYFYDDPTSGKFVLLPWDLDGTFTRLEPSVDPYTWHKEVRFHGRPLYELALSDPAWFDYYIDSVDRILHQAYDFYELNDLIDVWALQIHDAVFEDINKPFSNEDHRKRLDELKAFVVRRYGFIEQWLVCWQTGGVDSGDGTCVVP